MNSQIPNQGSNLCPLHWKHGVLTTRPLVTVNIITINNNNSYYYYSGLLPLLWTAHCFSCCVGSLTRFVILCLSPASLVFVVHITPWNCVIYFLAFYHLFTSTESKLHESRNFALLAAVTLASARGFGT